MKATKEVYILFGIRKENRKILPTFLCCHPCLFLTTHLSITAISQLSVQPPLGAPAKFDSQISVSDFILVLASPLIVPLCSNSNVNKIGTNTTFIFLSIHVPHIFPVVNVSGHWHLPAEDWTWRAILDFFSYHPLVSAP